MKDFAPHILFGIAEEAFGAWLYVGLLALACLAALYLYLALQRVSFSGGPRVAALAFGVVGAIVAVAVAPGLTGASFAHVVAGIDFVAMALIALGGFVAGFVVALPAFAALRGLPAEGAKVPAAPSPRAR